MTLQISSEAQAAPRDREYDAAADRRRARQVRRRPADGEARRGHRPAQPLAPAAARAGAGRGDRAQEHPHDRPHRRRQDRDRPPAGAPRQGARSSRSRPPSSPRSATSAATSSRWSATWSRSRSPWSRRRSARRCARPRPPAPRTACCSSWCRRGRSTPTCATSEENEDDLAATREKLRDKLARGRARRPAGRDRGRRGGLPTLRDVHAAGRRGGGHQPQGHAAGPLRPQEEAAGLGRRGARDPPAAGGREADRPRPGRPRGARARRAGGHRSSSTRSTRSPAARAARGPDVSREGVQRDLLPIVEGTTVTTKYGMVKTDHILFIAAGAFHVTKPSDLIPELQGRFPIRVELDAADRGGLRAHPDRARERADQAVLGAARDRGRAARVHRRRGGARSPASPSRSTRATENIGARRLSTLMERLLDEVSFEAPDMAGVRGEGRRRIRAPGALRHRPGPGPLALCPLAPADRQGRPCAAALLFAVSASWPLSALGCGKQGPPLPPLRAVPAPVKDLTVRPAGARGCCSASPTRR